MSTSATGVLVGRDQPQRLLRDWLTARTDRAEGERSTPAALFVSGEAGIGKTALIRAVTPDGDPVLRAAATPWSSTPYGLLDQLLPGLVGPFPSAAVPVDAVRAALLAAGTPITVVLEDLHWADNATLELLPALIDAVATDPVALIASYRSDELPRGHPIRALRAQLRHGDRLLELPLQALDAAAVGELVGRVIGGPPSGELVEVVTERTDGVPFFVEELLAGIAAAGWLSRDGDRIGLVSARRELAMPESIQDAVLLRVADLPAASRSALDAAAVLGIEFDLATVTELTGRNWPDDLDHCGLLQPGTADRRRFRHALSHEAVYTQVPWSRRRALHLAAAERIAARAAEPALLARHLLAARDHDRAWPALLAAADECLRAYACRDAARLLSTALEIWPPGTDEIARLDVVDRLARCAELSGDHTVAVTGLRELVDRQSDRPELPAATRAQAQQRLAVQYELLAQWAPALAARAAAADAFVEAGQPAQAAAERLAIAAHLRSAAGFSAALHELEQAEQAALVAERPELLSRIGGLRGNVLARMGHGEQGLSTVRAALDLALSHGLAAPAAEIYQRLADSLEHTGDYRAAGRVYDTAYEFCRSHDQEAAGQLCRACATVVMFHSGRWDQALRVCAGVLSAPDATTHAQAVARGVCGLVEAMRGHTVAARSALLESRAIAVRIELIAMELLSTWGLALVDGADGRAGQAVDSYRQIVQRCRQSQERHFCIPVLQFAAACFGAAGTPADLGAVADVLADAVNATGQPEARAALAHTLGEAALLAGEPTRALPHLRRALELLDPLDLPVVTTLLRRRAAVAMAQVAGPTPAEDPAHPGGEAADLLRTAYRTAHRLRAGPLLVAISGELRQLGLQPAPGVTGQLLTTREAQVLRLVGEGLTSKEIAAQLFLSVRTVEMHVRNGIARLGCRTRAEAVRRLGELDLA